MKRVVVKLEAENTDLLKRFSVENEFSQLLSSKIISLDSSGGGIELSQDEIEELLDMMPLPGEDEFETYHSLRDNLEDHIRTFAI